MKVELTVHVLTAVEVITSAPSVVSDGVRVHGDVGGVVVAPGLV